jgi:putative FmdB family regulatory protein
MPTYEYACKNCGEHIEVVQSFKDDPLTTCPNCGGELRKVFGSIGIAFKGSGFYKTDSRSSSSGGGGGSGSGGGSGGSTGGSGESKESKPAAAAASESKSTSTGDSKSASA